MSKPRSIETIQNSEYVSIGELAELSGVRYSTIKHYTEIGLIDYEQDDIGLKRKFIKAKSIEKLNEIKKLKTEKRLTISEIIDHFRK